MDLQAAFNILVALVGFLGGYVLNSMRDSIKAIKDSEAILIDKVQHMEVLIAGDYVKKNEMDRVVTNIFETLKDIDTKLTQYMLDQGKK